MTLKWTFAFVALASASAQRFEPARVCAMCHSKLAAPGTDGVNIAPYALWIGSMKANSALDPYWKAKVREEVALNPTAGSLIEDKCLRCHAPAQQYAYRAKNGHMSLGDLNQQGSDGVTCSVCHQVTAEGLGKYESFTAGFRIGNDDKIFGPHANPFSMPMLHHTGYQPTEARHVLESSLCATCHTVITPTLDSAGRVSGEFLEQAPYLEWLASDFPGEGQTCQSCHLPVLETRSYIAHRPPGGPFPPTSPRTPFGRHSFTGGNVQGPAMLAEILPDLASSFEQASQRARKSLAGAVRLKGDISTAGAFLEVVVDVENLTGHKLPTAYPSRRLWLHLTALDADGSVVFESGKWDPATAELKGASPSQTHHARITSPEQVMIYEAEYSDLQGRPTTSLLRAAKYSKDNRILPRGFSEKSRMPEGLSAARIAPVGTGADSDFVAGADRVIYQVPRTTARVQVEALYQSIKPAHAKATGQHDSAEAQRFVELFSRHKDPIVVATLQLQALGSR